jgi:hypothetical protein
VYLICRRAGVRAHLGKAVHPHMLRNVSPHCSSFVDSPYLLPLPSLLWTNRRNRPVVTTSGLGESGHQTPGWP